MSEPRFHAKVVYRYFITATHRIDADTRQELDEALNESGEEDYMYDVFPLTQYTIDDVEWDDFTWWEDKP